jgi:hypothetical protein
MKLLDLDPTFLAVESPGHHRYVDTLDLAHGVMFLCPKCFATNSGRIGTHHIICWFRGKVADSEVPGPGRWDALGTGLSDLTLTRLDGGPASILLTSGCCWHGYVRNGETIDC